VQRTHTYVHASMQATSLRQTVRPHARDCLDGVSRWTASSTRTYRY
jgi:hypothetical protein